MVLQRQLKVKKKQNSLFKKWCQDNWIAIHKQQIESFYLHNTQNLPKYESCKHKASKKKSTGEIFCDLR